MSIFVDVDEKPVEKGSDGFYLFSISIDKNNFLINIKIASNVLSIGLRRESR